MLKKPGKTEKSGIVNDTDDIGARLRRIQELEAYNKFQIQKKREAEWGDGDDDDNSKDVCEDCGAEYDPCSRYRCRDCGRRIVDLGRG